MSEDETRTTYVPDPNPVRLSMVYVHPPTADEPLTVTEELNAYGGYHVPKDALKAHHGHVVYVVSHVSSDPSAQGELKLVPHATYCICGH